MQVDGNVSYEDKGKETAVTLIHCLVHSRRKFTEALEYDKKKSGYVLEEIKKLYLIERQMDEEAYDFETKLKTRQELSVPILLALKSGCWIICSQIYQIILFNALPKYMLGKGGMGLLSTPTMEY
ncbi:MAG: transposase [Saprospiraceae bacterium]|nr:transposase [Saprospiraceae bacterium]